MDKQEFKIKRRVLDLDVYGTTYELKMPSSKARNDFMKKINETDLDDQYEMMCEYLEGLGLPKDVTYEIEDGDILDVIEMLHSKKKK